LGNLKERDHFGHLEADGRIILHCDIFAVDNLPN
jgi:hypothetical protein